MMPSFSYRKCLQTFAKKISTKEDDVDTVLNFSETANILAQHSRLSGTRR